MTIAFSRCFAMPNAKIMALGGIVLSFGWQSAGMGIGRGYELIEVMMVSHGGGHNDTLCIAERRMAVVTSHNQGGAS